MAHNDHIGVEPVPFTRTPTDQWPNNHWETHLPHDSATERTTNGNDSSGSAIKRARVDIIKWWLFSVVPLVATLVTFIALLGSNIIDGNDKGYILALFEATRLLVPLQVAALVAPWNIGHNMKLCAYWVGHRATVSRSGYDLNNTTVAEQRPHHAHQSTVQDAKGTITSHLFFASPMSALTALGYALRPTEATTRRHRWLRYFPGKPRRELNEYLVLTTTVLSATALLYVLFVGLVTLLAALTSMETHEIITPLQVPQQQFGGGTSYSCGLTPASGGFVLTNSTEGIRTVNNASDVNQVLYESQNRVALLAPKDLSRALDYSARTLGVRTQCRSKGAECRLRLSRFNDDEVTHSCRPEKSTNKTSLSMAESYTADVILSDGKPNPFHYWVWGVVDKTETKISDDSEIVNMGGNAISILLDCSITVYNVSYSVQNGTVSPNTLVTNIADDAPSYVVADPLALKFSQNQLYDGLRLAAVTSNDVSALASVISVSVSEMALAYIAGIFEPLQNEKESARRDVQAARLPVALVWIIVTLGVFLILQAKLLFGFALALVWKDPNAAAERDALT
ncbi:hypothetical protein FALBO_884 [Fusarium albosuccineum]|uniref:Uncharacterized protein n=1 Tax=Fusarium albosuccineum TaxID=1237068 RepID=A0A8H4LP95_9HYPO|nr:hypothetical protein FALBO_884 [Fusarium albosuccineum]